MRRWIGILVAWVLLVAVQSGYAAEQSALVGAHAGREQQKTMKEYLFGSYPLGWADLDWEADLYYSNVSLNIPLTDTQIPHVSDATEVDIYQRLWLNAFRPRFMLLEAAVMPMPVAGVLIRKHAESFYNGADIGKSQNVVQWLTAGFQEPYSFSLFVGDMIKFDRPGEEKLSSNKGYMGYMLSYSDQHIKNNLLIPDHSLEVEWKMKGERSFKDEKLSWSFRLGAKIHDHPEIRDTYYVGFRRSNLDFTANPFEFLRNSSFELRVDFGTQNGDLIRQEYVLGKKYPIAAWKTALKLDLGLIWESPSRYTGSLKNSSMSDYIIVLRPNIQF